MEWGRDGEDDVFDAGEPGRSGFRRAARGRKPDSRGSRAGAELGGVWHPAIERGRERGLLWKAFGIALALHVGVLMISFPELRREVLPQPERRYVVVRKYVPPPPRIERPRVAQPRKLTRKLPVPDPTPAEPEPIREPLPEIEAPPLDEDVEYLLGEPEAPPLPVAGSGEPLIAGAGDVTNPERIEESYVQPHYPELARVARVQGSVVLQAVILKNGSVGEVRVLRCSSPGFGFEEEAQKAVELWRYYPATQNGRPVDVYFTVFVDFTLI